ncbi:hypothetical protein P7C70_g3746, partial [Phenoliferia sp. Uapishka_3]
MGSSYSAIQTINKEHFSPACRLVDDDWLTLTYNLDSMSDLALFDDQTDMPMTTSSVTSLDNNLKDKRTTPAGDFELFSWDDDEQQQVTTAKSDKVDDSPFGSPTLNNSADPTLLPSSTTGPLSPSLLPLPDLVPDSPTSPRTRPFLHDHPSILRGDSYYRSSSAPVPEGPRKKPLQPQPPIDFSNQPIYNSNRTNNSLSQSLGHQRPQPVYNLGGDSSYPISPTHPQSTPIQPTHHFSPPHSSSRLAELSQPASDPASSLRKTVSPQEAFLDYDDVDHALHSNPRYSAFGAVGVGAGAGIGSLFAPLPVVNGIGSGERRMSAPGAAGHDLEIRRARSGSPVQLGKVSGAGARFANRFSVPRNAVSWEDSHPVEEDDDSVEEDSGEGSAGDGETKGRREGGEKERERREEEEEEMEEDEPDTPPLFQPAPYNGKGKSAEQHLAPIISTALPTNPSPLSNTNHPNNGRPNPLKVRLPIPASYSDESDKGEEEEDELMEEVTHHGRSYDSDEYVPDEPILPQPHHQPAPPAQPTPSTSATTSQFA